MEIQTYFSILWRRKWIIFITTTLTFIVATVGTLLITPEYKATATLRVATTNDSVSYGDLLYAQRLMNTFPAIVKSGPVLTKLRQQLNIEKVPSIKVAFPLDSELMNITVIGEDPELAAQVANLLANLLMSEVRQMRTGRNAAVSLIDAATAPKSPTSPRAIFNIGLGVIVGLAGGLGLAFLFENVDTTLYSTKQIEMATEWPIIAHIPQVNSNQVTSFGNGTTPQGEALRYLRTNIFTPLHETSLQTLMITSAEPREGKSTITANLASTIALGKQNVVVVDADMRLPTLHQIFKLPNQSGLSTVLSEEATLSDALQKSEVPCLSILTSGPLPNNPAELLSSSRMAAVIQQLKQQFDVILLDTPALLPVTDAAILTAIADGIVFIIGRTQSRKESIDAAHRQLANVNDKLVGVVVNRAQRNYRYDYYRSSSN